MPFSAANVSSSVIRSATTFSVAGIVLIVPKLDTLDEIGKYKAEEDTGRNKEDEDIGRYNDEEDTGRNDEDADIGKYSADAAAGVK